MNKHGNEVLLEEGYRKRKKRVQWITLILILVTACLCLLHLVYGNTIYPPVTIFRVLRGEKVEGAYFAILTLRLPRMLAGLLAGFSFGVAGNIFQTILRNPLASPDIIGITSGSSVAAVFCILVLGMSGSMVSVAAVISGLMVAISIYFLTSGGSFSGGKLILIGIGVQAVLNAVISYLLLRASQYDVSGAMRWLSGSLNGMQLDDIPWLLVVSLIATSVPLVLTRQIQVLELGEEKAIVLGVHTNKTRILLIISAVCLIAFATAVTGPIAFVAFLSGPIARRMIGRHSTGVLAAGFVGSILVLTSDFFGQYAFTTRLPVGVITGILGAPYLLFLLIGMNKRGGSNP